jgi:hypothetical protein
VPITNRRLELKSQKKEHFSMDTVPFKLNDVFGGFGEGHGLLRNEGAHLCLEYQVQDGIIGAIKSDVKELRIPFEEVLSVALTKGWFGTSWGVKLVIQLAHLELLEDVPGANQGRIELSIAARDHDLAEEFIYHLHANDNAPATSAPA